MLVSAIKSFWKTDYDEMFSGELPTSRLNDVFAEAQTVYWQGIKNSYQLSKSITSLVQQLLIDTTFTPNSNNEVLLSSLTNYEDIVAIRPVYTVGGITYSEEWAEERLTANLNDKYSDGDYRYPRYRMVQGKILLEPAAPQCGASQIMFFRTPYVIDFNNPTNDIPYIDEAIRGIINEALKITARIFREDTYYVQEQREITQTKSLG